MWFLLLFLFAKIAQGAGCAVLGTQCGATIEVQQRKIHQRRQFYPDGAYDIFIVDLVFAVRFGTILDWYDACLEGGISFASYCSPLLL